MNGQKGRALAIEKVGKFLLQLLENFRREVKEIGKKLQKEQICSSYRNLDTGRLVSQSSMDEGNAFGAEENDRTVERQDFSKCTRIIDPVIRYGATQCSRKFYDGHGLLKGKVNVVHIF